MSLMRLLALLIMLLLDSGDGDGDGDEAAKAAATKAAEKEAAEEAAKAEREKAEAELGEAGKKALNAERTSAKVAKKEATAATKRADVAEKKLAEIEAEGASDAEKAIATATKAAKKEAESEVGGRYKRRILETEVLAAATGKLQTPGDAVRLLDLEEFDVPDPDADDAELAALRKTIGEAVDKLIADSPYLRTSKVKGDGDGGAKPTPVIEDKDLTPSQRLSRGYANAEK